MKNTWVSLAAVLVASTALAKLPPPSDAAKAKAAEATAKAAWQAKIDAFELCRAQDKVAAVYRKGHPDKPAPAQPAAAAASGAASAAAGTPVKASAPPPCADPGPFAYNPPEQKPIETSEAHSPAGNATSPPSQKSTAGAPPTPNK